MTVDRVTFLACGWALASEHTHGTSIALDLDGETILIDAGGEVAKGLVRIGRLDELSRIYLTHEHPDHTWALPGLLHCLRFAGDRDGLSVHGPVRALARARAALAALGVTTPFDVTWVPLEPSGGQDERVRWAPADHSVPTLSYRLGDVTVCGDTRPSGHTVELARGSSLLVHEATHTDQELVHKSGHATPADAARMAREAGVDLLALTHLHPSLQLDEVAKQVDVPQAIGPQDGDQLVRKGANWKHVRPDHSVVKVDRVEH